MCSLSRLTTLAVPNNALKNLPEVKKLFWAFNSTTLFGSTGCFFHLQNIGGLVSLQILDLRCNDIQEIPLSVGRLSNLRVLDMRINDIHLVSILFLFLPHRSSELSTCSQVPGSLGGLLSLRELNLSNNRLTSIPASLVQLPNLSSLKLAANRLEVSE